MTTATASVTAKSLYEQAAQCRTEAEQAKQKLEFEFAFLLLDQAERLEMKAAQL